MKSSNIATIAGTPVDTEFARTFLEQNTSKKVLHYAISKNPDEQNLLQLNDPEKLFQICLNQCLEFKKKNVQKVLIYCNSLSSSINISKLEKESGLKIITPIDIYKNISSKYKNILIIAANSVGAILPEKIIRQNNIKTQITTIGYLSLVNHIELKLNPEVIFNSSGLEEVLNFAKKINIDLILLACTHFPYISSVLKNKTKIDVLDLDEGLWKLCNF